MRNALPITIFALLTLLCVPRLAYALGGSGQPATSVKFEDHLAAVEPWLDKVERIRSPLVLIDKTETDKRLRDVCSGLLKTEPAQWPLAPGTAAAATDEAASDAIDASRRANTVANKIDELAPVLAAMRDLRDACAGVEDLSTFTSDHWNALLQFAAAEASPTEEFLRRIDIEAFDQALRAYARNPVLGLSGLKTQLEAAEARGTGAFQAGPFASLLGGGQGQAVAEGLAQFLFERAKQESIDYLRKLFIDRLCDAEAPAAVFARDTCAFLSSLDGSTTLRSMGQALRRAVIDDLRRLPDVGLALAATYDEKNAGAAQATTVLRVALGVAQDAHDGGEPLAFLRSLHAAPLIDCEALDDAKRTQIPGAAACHSTMGLLRSASALLAAAGMQSDDLVDLPRDNYTLVAVMLAWTVRGSAIPAGVDAKYAPKALDHAALTRVVVPLGYVIKAYAASTKVVRELAALRQAGLSVEGAKDLLAASDEAIRAGLLAAEVVRCALSQCSKPAPKPSTTSSASPLFDTSLDGLIAGAVGGQSTSTKFFVELASLAKDLGNEDWAKAVPRALDLVEPFLEPKVGEDNWSTIDNLIPVLVELGSAESSAEVAATLDAAVPAGGYKSKYRNTAISINGFLGFQGSGEFYKAGEQSVRASSIGMFAPVGLHFSTPLGRKYEHGWYLGILASAVDLGAITARKLSDDVAVPTDEEVEEVPPLDLRTLISLGGYVNFGIARSPFTLGIGASYNPALRESTEGTVIEATRITGFIAVDITMFSFRLGKAR